MALTAIHLADPKLPYAISMSSEYTGKYFVPVYQRPDGKYEVIRDAYREPTGFIRLHPNRGETMPTIDSKKLFESVISPAGADYRLTDPQAKAVISYALEHYPALTWTLRADPSIRNAERTFTIIFTADVAAYVRQQDSAPAYDSTPLVERDASKLIQGLAEQGWSFDMTPSGGVIASYHSPKAIADIN